MQTASSCSVVLFSCTSYHSNQRTRAKPDEFSLFVHVPSFSTRAVEEQLTFIRALLSALAHQVLDSDTSH